MLLAGFEISENELDLQQIRASGPGGQHVNKVSSAVHLRFDIQASSLPDVCKQRLLSLRDRRVSTDGVVVIKSQRHRSQEKNRAEAITRLEELIMRALRRPKPRKATRPPAAAKRRRVDDKKAKGRLKKLRNVTRHGDE